MRKTTKSVMIEYSMNGSMSKFRRVYEDENGKYYIKNKDGYKCINDLPCMNYIIED